MKTTRIVALAGILVRRFCMRRQRNSRESNEPTCGGTISAFLDTRPFKLGATSPQERHFPSTSILARRSSMPSKAR